MNCILSSCLFAFLLLLLPIRLLFQCAYISDDCFVSAVQIVVHADHVLSSFGKYKLLVFSALSFSPAVVHFCLQMVEYQKQT